MEDMHREAPTILRHIRQSITPGEIMETNNDITAANDYCGTDKTFVENAGPERRRTGRTDHSEPEVLVELVVIAGAEGERLHAIQAEVVRRALLRIAERHMQTPQEGSRL
jgi:hypothetical protein